MSAAAAQTRRIPDEPGPDLHPGIEWLVEYTTAIADKPDRLELLRALVALVRSGADQGVIVGQIVADVLSHPEWGAWSHTEPNSRERSALVKVIMLHLPPLPEPEDWVTARQAAWKAWISASRLAGHSHSTHASGAAVVHSGTAYAAHAAFVATSDRPWFAISMMDHAALCADPAKFHAGLVETVQCRLAGAIAPHGLVSSTV